MAVWRGLGLLTVFIAAAMIAAVGFLAQFIGIDEAGQWPEAIALLLSGIIVWFLGRALHSTAEASWTNASVKSLPLQVSIPSSYVEEHSLLFIRMEYWGPIFAAAGIVTLFVQ